MFIVLMSMWMLGVQSIAEAPSLKLDAALDAAARLPRLHSLLVSWRGALVVERYFNGTKPARPANLKSASKSVISALVGIAIDRGQITNVKQPIGSYFPDLLSAEPNKRGITIEDLLTMRSGLESTSNRNYGAWVLSGNWVRYALNRPLLDSPGTTMEYSTGNTHLLSAILTRATGKSTWQFAQETLAKPLGFSLPQWPRDPQGVYFGGNDMLMTPRHMLMFGEMYLNGGRANGQQVVSARWVAASLLHARHRGARATAFTAMDGGFATWRISDDLRVGIWRAVHFSRSRSGPCRGHDLFQYARDRTPRTPPDDLRHRRAFCDSTHCIPVGQDSESVQFFEEKN